MMMTMAVVVVVEEVEVEVVVLREKAVVTTHIDHSKVVVLAGC